MAIIVKGGGGKPEEEKTVTAGTSVIEVLPSSGKVMKKVTINPTPTESKSVTPTTSELTVTPSEGKHLSQVVVGAVEDVTPEVTAQTPVITQIAENLGVTITTPSGTNKQILQGNNANLLNIKNNAKKEGAYVWKKLTAEGGDFADFVVSDQSTAYPDGGEQGGYWYEKVVLLENGIFFNAINDNGQPTDITIKSTKGFDDILGTPGYISVLENVLINMPEITDSCLDSTFRAFKGKIKIKNATNIGRYAFAYIGGANSTTYAYNIKLYIPATCTTIYGNENDEAACPFYNRVGPINIYCEASSKPSGWGDYWNIVGAGHGFHTTMWGVTESSFDAL